MNKPSETLAGSKKDDAPAGKPVTDKPVTNKTVTDKPGANDPGTNAVEHEPDPNAEPIPDGEHKYVPRSPYTTGNY